MLTSAFRAVRFHGVVRHRHRSTFINGANGSFRPVAARQTHFFSSTTNTNNVAALDDGKTYQIKSTSYTNTEYDLSNKLSGLTGSYDPSSFEKNVYDWWEKAGCFDPDCKSTNNNNEKGEPYVLPMPPPNVTGRLHMGHAIFVALQDVLARFHRMRGKSVLWTPGTDHAGIATQLQVCCLCCCCFIEMF
jgi:hypothetical protein